MPSGELTYGLNKTVWLEFFRAYHEMPELWETGNSLYKDRNRKAIALRKLLVIYNKLDPNADVDALKKRINTVRSCYRRELIKVLKSRKDAITVEEIYVPNLWYYDELDFLGEQYKPAKRRRCYFDEDDESDPLDMPATLFDNEKKALQMSAELSDREATDKMDSELFNEKEDDDAEVESDAEKTRKREHESESESYLDPTPEMEEQEEPETYEQPQRTRRSVRMRNSTRKSLPPAQSSNGETMTEDEAAVFAASWATSFRKLVGVQKIYAKKAIEEILALGQLEVLSFAVVNTRGVSGVQNSMTPTRHDYRTGDI